MKIPRKEQYGYERERFLGYYGYQKERLEQPPCIDYFNPDDDE